eukprot:PRCOL_00006636-RA
MLPPYERACGGKGSRPAARPPAALSAEDVSASGRGLWLVRGVLPAGACATLCAAAEPSLRACGSRGPAFGEAARRHTRAEADDMAAAAFARALWERSGLREALAGVLPAEIGGRAPVGLSRRLRVYSYDERGSEHFGRHLDGSDLAQADGGRGARTEFTLLLYLRAPAAGGQTRFYDERGGVCGDVAPVEGAALAFRQGYDVCLEHESVPVTSGTKVVLRTDVVYA